MTATRINYKKSAYKKIISEKKQFLREFIKLLICFDLNCKAERYFEKFMTAKSVDVISKQDGFSYERIDCLIEFSNITLDECLLSLKHKLKLINRDEYAFDDFFEDIDRLIEIKFKEFLGE